MSRVHSRDALIPLVERLEVAEAGSRELDKAVWLAAGQAPQWGGPFDGAGNGVWEGPHVSHSLDAALALAERVLPGWKCVIYQHTPTLWYCRFDAPEGEVAEARFRFSDEFDTWCYAPTPALALCRSVLRTVANSDGPILGGDEVKRSEPNPTPTGSKP